MKEHAGGDLGEAAVRAKGDHVRLGTVRAWRSGAFAGVVFGVLFALALPARAETPAEAMAAGDRAYALRGQKNDGKGHADPAQIKRAIAAYKRAYALAPEDLKAAWKLMAALFFAGDFTAANDAEAKAWFGQGKKVSEEALPRLEKRLGLSRPLASMDADEIRRAVPKTIWADVAALYFWSAIDWGAWSRYEGLWSVVRSGVAGKLRDDCKVSLALDPSIYRGGAQRLMAHLHATLPRVPFVSGWVKRKDALGYADAAMKILPADMGNQTILGLVLIETVPKRRAEGMRMLEKVLAEKPRPNLVVEDQATQGLARETLAKTKAKSSAGAPSG